MGFPADRGLFLNLYALKGLGNKGALALRGTVESSYWFNFKSSAKTATRLDGNFLLCTSHLVEIELIVFSCQAILLASKSNFRVAKVRLSDAAVTVNLSSDPLKMGSNVAGKD
jgi:hypothetical protein